MAGTEWKDADRISDQITDMINAERARGVSPLQIFAGLCLGLLGFMRNAPGDAPAPFRALDECLDRALGSLLRAR